MLQLADLEAFEHYLKSGEFEDHFSYSPPERRFEMLELLEKIMDIADTADEVATRILLQGSPLGQMAGFTAPDSQE